MKEKNELPNDNVVYLNSSEINHGFKFIQIEIDEKKAAIFFMNNSYPEPQKLELDAVTFIFEALKGRRTVNEILMKDCRPGQDIFDYIENHKYGPSLLKLFRHKLFLFDEKFEFIDKNLQGAINELIKQHSNPLPLRAPAKQGLFPPVSDKEQTSVDKGKSLRF